jgi:formylglycine-generating enzyme required for sulfatase activity
MLPAHAPLSFGHAALARRLVDELQASLLPGAGSSTEPALVIGVFGEWGAGKSRLLQTVADGIHPGDGERTLNVVVPFSAWRYEREEHLLVPLLRVAQQCLRKALEESLDEGIRRNERLSDRLVLLGDLAQTVYQHGGRELLQTALASQGVVLKLPELKTEAGKPQPSTWARWRERRTALKRARLLQTPVDQLHSLYYDFLEHLKAVTGRNPKALALHRERLKYRGLGWWPRLKYRLGASWGWLGTGEMPPELHFQLNLVFLVDDLDRCLPDKAVEVLEAIKLFLEVEGCAFVLALDEEVVERGIAHRYRDYALQGKEGMTPITGAEYLEKLVHLPVRLPRPTRAEAEDFLAFKHPELFASTGRPNELARLVAAITPSVPRKLHRMIDLLEMADQLAATVGGQGPERRHWLAIVCALQLFTPSLYRYVRLRGPTLLLTLADWRADARLRDLDALRVELTNDVRAVTSPAELNYRLVLLRLPDLCAAVLQNRSGFDLLELLAQVGELRQRAPLSATQLGALLAFTEMKPEDSAPAPAPMAPVVATAVVPEPAAPPPVVEMPAAAAAMPLPVEPPPAAEPAPPPVAGVEARLEDERGLLEALVSGDPEVVRFALSREGETLRGRSLPEGFWQMLYASPWLSSLKDWMEEGMPPGPVEQNLRELRPHLSQAMALQLLHGFGAPLQAVLRRPSWANRVRMEGAVLQVLAPPLDRDLRVWLPTHEPATAASWQVPRGWFSPPAEIWSERLGDHKAALKLGADARFGVFALLTITREGGARPVTQRLRWMEPGSFTMGSPLSEIGRLSDERQPLQMHLPEGFWMADTACTWGMWWMLMAGDAPSGWDGDRDNDPATGMCPDEAVDFMQRLDRLLPPCSVRLPIEVEWEYACRAGTSTPWAFGTDVNSSQVHMLGSAPRPVASLPPNAWGLYEMHGNAAEICLALPPVDAGSGASEASAAPERFALRGGSFADPPVATRSAAVQGVARREIRRDAGFRLTLRARDKAEASTPELPDWAKS